MYINIWFLPSVYILNFAPFDPNGERASQYQIKLLSAFLRFNISQVVVLQYVLTDWMTDWLTDWLTDSMEQRPSSEANMLTISKNIDR
jgi:hypothetical protein